MILTHDRRGMGLHGDRPVTHLNHCHSCRRSRRFPFQHSEYLPNTSPY
ncbi:MAG TPA: hypothetical protein V6C84_14650 [Coleofasciculaceae cyanobacterium]